MFGFERKSSFVLNGNHWSSRSDIFQFFCPFCKVERRLNWHPNPWRIKNFLRVCIATAFVTLLLWPLFHWRGLVTLFPLMAIFETVYRIRLRTLLSCPSCGFDAYLFLQNAQEAKTHMKEFWDQKVKKSEDVSDPSLNPSLNSEKNTQNTETTASL